jgi:hypothetical protein
MIMRVRVGFGLVVAAILATSLSPVHVLHAASPSRLVLNLRLKSTQDLPAFTRLALMAETQEIWDEAHVRLRWIEHDGDAVAGSMLRVLLMARAVPAPGGKSPFAVGELVRYEGDGAFAIASLTGARRIVDDTRSLLVDPPQTHDRRIGVVLGRAVAHEIGHFLLQTNTHASDGLMRARIRAREFADLSRESFRLDKAAEAHLAALAVSGALSPDLKPFSYERQ